MELLKEDKTLKASQRERGAGLGKRTEQKEEIIWWRAEIRGRTLSFFFLFVSQNIS